MYLIQALPDLGIRWETVALRLEPCELALLQRQFGLLTISLWEIDKEAEVHHIFCAESIDETLDNARHLCRPLSAVCKRRIYLDTQELVDQLAAIRRALEQRPQYKVCFIPREWFVRIRMEIVVWGNEAAVAWIAARQSRSLPGLSKRRRPVRILRDRMGKDPAVAPYPTGGGEAARSLA